MRKLAERRPGIGGGESAPAINKAAGLMAGLLTSAINDAGKDLNAIAELLTDAMMALPSSGDGGRVENLLAEMIGHLQCIDLLHQRIEHVTDVLNIISDSESTASLKFDDVVGNLWRAYSCQQEREFHNDFIVQVERAVSRSYSAAGRN